MSYQDKLKPWTIVRLEPDEKRLTVARFRRRSDAEGHLRALKQVMPQAEFAIMFESPREPVS